jgi:hypothetical protein
VIRRRDAEPDFAGMLPHGHQVFAIILLYNFPPGLWLPQVLYK